MMTIRRDQMRMFEVALLPAFIRAVTAKIRAMDVGGASLQDEETVSQRVAEAVANARSLGIETREGLRVFACLTFELSPSFYEDPGVAALLCDRGISERERFDMLVQRLARDTAPAKGSSSCS